MGASCVQTVSGSFLCSTDGKGTPVLPWEDAVRPNRWGWWVTGLLHTVRGKQGDAEGVSPCEVKCWHSLVKALTMGWGEEKGWSDKIWKWVSPVPCGEQPLLLWPGGFPRHPEPCLSIRGSPYQHVINVESFPQRGHLTLFNASLPSKPIVTLFLWKISQLSKEMMVKSFPSRGPKWRGERFRAGWGLRQGQGGSF